MILFPVPYTESQLYFFILVHILWFLFPATPINLIISCCCTYSLKNLQKMSKCFAIVNMRAVVKFRSFFDTSYRDNLQENKTQLEKRIRELHDTQVREKYVFSYYFPILILLNALIQDKISKETAQSSELIRHKLSELSDYVNAVSAQCSFSISHEFNFFLSRYMLI